MLKHKNHFGHTEESDNLEIKQNNSHPFNIAMSNSQKPTEKHELANVQTPASLLNTTQISIFGDHKQWRVSLMNKVQALVTQHIPHAEIKLNPPNLGSITANIQMSEAKISVNLHCENNDVARAIEQTLPILKESLHNTDPIRNNEISVTNSGLRNDGNQEQSNQNHGRFQTRKEEPHDQAPSRTKHKPKKIEEGQRIDYYA
jgi:flagellar hook-length control protein FliK